MEFLGPGETFSAIGAFSDRLYPATAIALEPVGIWLLGRDVAQRVIEAMADRLIHLVALVEDLSLRPVAGRLARMLLDGATGDVIHRPKWYTQTELAARLGTVPDVIQRALSSLALEGLIEVERNSIRIRDRAALEKMAG